MAHLYTNKSKKDHQKPGSVLRHSVQTHVIRFTTIYRTGACYKINQADTQVRLVGLPPVSQNFGWQHAVLSPQVSQEVGAGGVGLGGLVGDLVLK